MPEETFRWAITGGVIIATLCMLTLAVLAMLMYRVIAKVQLRVDDIASKVEPIIDTVRRLAHDNAPKVDIVANNVVEISANAKDISGVAKDQAHRYADVGRDIADRAKAQISRVDSLVDETVENVQQTGDHVKAAVMKPVREAGAVLAGVRAAVTVLVDGKRPTVDHVTQDEEMFI